MAKAKITRTNADFAICEPVIIRPGMTTRLVFKPVVVNNKKDKFKPVKGELVWQRKSKENEWQDDATLKLTEMKAGSGVKLALSTDDLYQLTLTVRALYGFFWKNGLPKDGDEIELESWAKSAKEIGDPIELIGEIIGDAGVDSLAAIMQWAVQTSDAKLLIEHLSRLDAKSVNEINTIAGISTLKNILDAWKSNETNADEDFWQDTFEEYPLVLSQVFSSPVIILRGKAYVGGKTLEGTGGKYPDYILKNAITQHALLVEIKTPATQLLLGSPYRPPDIYAVAKDVSGAVTQIAKYKDEFLKTFHEKFYSAEEEFALTEPQCLIVIGHSDQLDNNDRNDSFELFRRNQRHTDIITFDELFGKIETLVTLLEGSHD